MVNLDDVKVTYLILSSALLHIYNSPLHHIADHTGVLISMLCLYVDMM